MPAKPPSTNIDLFKIVLFGPRGAGKRTNIRAVERGLTKTPPPSSNGQETVAELLELKIADNFRVPLILSAVDSKHAGDDAWKTSMRGLHGLIFVADSSPERFEENVEAMADVIGKMAFFRIKFDHFPIVVQYNKRDIDGATSLSRLEEALNPLGLPAFSAVAKDGIGACECVRTINLLIEKSLKAGKL